MKYSKEKTLYLTSSAATLALIFGLHTVAVASTDVAEPMEIDGKGKPATAVSAALKELENVEIPSGTNPVSAPQVSLEKMDKEIEEENAKELEALRGKQIAAGKLEEPAKRKAVMLELLAHKNEDNVYVAESRLTALKRKKELDAEQKAAKAERVAFEKKEAEEKKIAALKAQLAELTGETVGDELEEGSKPSGATDTKVLEAIEAKKPLEESGESQPVKSTTEVPDANTEEDVAEEVKDGSLKPKDQRSWWQSVAPRFLGGKTLETDEKKAGTEAAADTAEEGASSEETAVDTTAENISTEAGSEVSDDLPPLLEDATDDEAEDTKEESRTSEVKTGDDALADLKAEVERDKAKNKTQKNKSSGGGLLALLGMGGGKDITNQSVVASGNAIRENSIKLGNEGVQSVANVIDTVAKQAYRLTPGLLVVKDDNTVATSDELGQISFLDSPFVLDPKSGKFLLGSILGTNLENKTLVLFDLLNENRDLFGKVVEYRLNPGSETLVVPLMEGYLYEFGGLEKKGTAAVAYAASYPQADVDKISTFDGTQIWPVAKKD